MIPMPGVQSDTYLAKENTSVGQCKWRLLYLVQGAVVPPTAGLVSLSFDLEAEFPNISKKKKIKIIIID